MNKFIATLRTAKHRFFITVDSRTLVESEIVMIGCGDYYVLGVLSSAVHIIWALAKGGTLEDLPRYNNSVVFEIFPAATPAQQEKIRALGEQLDAHRKRQQIAHPGLTMTDMYNVLERVRELEGAGGSGLDDRSPRPPPAASRLNAKEKKTYEEGLVGILRQLHDELDAAVAEAYGWDLTPGPSPKERGGMPSTDEILTKLVALNAERAAEEAKGQVRWLRPEYQLKGKVQAKGKQAKMDVGDEEAPAAVAALRTWPDELPAQAAALSAVLGTLAAPADVSTIAGHFEGKKTKKRLEEVTRLLETLAALGRARENAGAWTSS